MQQVRWLLTINVVWAFLNLSLSLALLLLPARYPKFVARFTPWLIGGAVAFQLISIVIWFRLG